MTKNEFAKKIGELIWEEGSDMEKYKALAESAPEKYAPILRDIAKEEAAHRRHLEKIQEDMPCAASEENEHSKGGEIGEENGK